MSEENKDQTPSEAAEGDVVTTAADDVVGVVDVEADPHGATVVAAVGNESGVQAVAVMDTDYTNTVLAAEFANPDAAKAAYMALLQAEVEGRLRIDGVLAVHADGSGKIHVDKMTDHSTKTGLKWGAVGGVVLGVLFPPTIIASAVGWGIVGSALGKVRNIHHHKQVEAQLEGAIGPNNSGIIALVHSAQLAQVKEQIPEATKVTTAEVDEETSKTIAEEAKAAAE